MCCPTTQRCYCHRGVKLEWEKMLRLSNLLTSSWWLIKLLKSFPICLCIKYHWLPTFTIQYCLCRILRITAFVLLSPTTTAEGRLCIVQWKSVMLFCCWSLLSSTDGLILAALHEISLKIKHWRQICEENRTNNARRIHEDRKHLDVWMCSCFLSWLWLTSLSLPPVSPSRP